MEDFWGIYEGFMVEDLWRIYGGIMEDLWRTYGGFMEDLWRIYEGFMEDIWRIYGGFMEDLWKIYGEFMEDLWRVYGGFMEDLWWIYDGFMEVSVSCIFTWCHLTGSNMPTCQVSLRMAVHLLDQMPYFQGGWDINLWAMVVGKSSDLVSDCYWTPFSNFVSASLLIKLHW